MRSGIIFDIKRFSTHDGPGIRTTVFFKGCPLACLWCHNPESQDRAPQIMLRPARCIACGACVNECARGAITWNGNGVFTNRALCTSCGVCTLACAAEARELVGRTATTAEIMAEVIRDLAFYDESGGGVTFSGGEPLLQPDFLLDLLRACKRQEIHTAVDTSGAAPWAALAEIAPFVDLFLYDLKLIDAARHKAATGGGNRLILDNLRRLAANGAAIQLRVALIPGQNDDQPNLRATAAFAAQLPGLRGLSLLPYHETARDKYDRLGLTYPLAHTAVPTETAIESAATLLRSYGLTVTVGA